MNYVYNNGLPFGDKLKDNIEDQIDRVKKKFPSLIIIDGGQGQGKTTLAVNIINYINSYHGLPPCSLKIKKHPQLSLGGTEFINNFNVCKLNGFPVAAYDEAGDFSKRGAIGRFNAMINRRFETYRSSEIIVIIIVPTFTILDNHLFDLKIPRMLLHCKDREKTINYGNYFGYSYYRMQWIRYWFDRLPKAIRYQCYNKTQFNFPGHFKTLIPERELQLAKLSDYGKDKESRKAAIKMEGLVSYHEIAQKVNRSVIYVRKIILEKNIKERRIIERAKYFDSSVIDVVTDYVYNR